MLLLPAWRTLLEDMKMSVRNMPCDVSTRWNSTFGMLDFALLYQKPIKSMVTDPDHELSQYALTTHEWKIAKQLRDVLEVHHTVTAYASTFEHLSYCTDSQGCHSIFLSRNTEPCHGHTCNGPYWRTLCNWCNKPIVWTVHSISTGHCKEDSEPLLQHDRPFGSLPHCYGYVSVDPSSITLLTLITVLHPRHKVAYFKSANWEPEWIESAEKIVRKEYERSYASRTTSIDHGDEVEILSEAPSVRTTPSCMSASLML